MEPTTTTTTNEIAKDFADDITVDNFDSKLVQGDTVGSYIFDRLSEIFDKEVDEYDSTGNTINFNFKDYYGGSAVQLIHQGDNQYFIDYIY